LRLFQSIRPLKSANAIRDALAGFVLAAMNIPQALGYTRIAGMPVVTGLYTLLLPLVAFAAFGSSRYLVVAADSATAAILAGGVSTMAPPASARYIALAGLVALLTAVFLLIGRLLQLGFIADFLSQTVLVGFLTGVGLQVGIAVLPETLGLETHSRRTIIQFVEVLRNLSHVHMPTLAVAAAVLAFVLVQRRVAPKFPGPLIAVVGAITASIKWDFAGHGISTIGPVVGGLPHLALPDLNWRDAISLLGVAASCAIMIVTQSAATARVYAGRHHQRLDENDDLVGLAAANAGAAITGTFVVNGSPTQTAMVESAGAQSQVAQISTAVIVALVLLFLTRPLQYLPHCVLGALVLLVAIRLIDVRGLREISQESPGEYALAITTAAVVVLAGVEQGIVLAMAMSLFRIVHHSYHPHSGVMVRDENGIWTMIPVAPGAVTEPGLVVYRFGAALFYANAGRFADEINCVVGPAPSPVRWLVIDAEAITRVDYTAARILRELMQDLSTAGVMLAFARVPWELRADLDRHHLTELIGSDRMYNHLHNARDAYRKTLLQ
jgi:SulP family sulfate permease